MINQIKPAGILLTVLSAPIFGDMLPPDFGGLGGVIFCMQANASQTFPKFLPHQ